MSLLDLIVPKTKVPEPTTEIAGTLTRFGMARADEWRNVFVFRIEGYDEMFEFWLPAHHEHHRIGLVAAGDRISAVGVLRDGVIKDCLVDVRAGRDRVRFMASMRIFA